MNNFGYDRLKREAADQLISICLASVAVDCLPDLTRVLKINQENYEQEERRQGYSASSGKQYPCDMKQA
eukprot:4677807-Pleurochrysis_carterae.AAC.3